jgi:hypothetical protein
VRRDVARDRKLLTLHQQWLATPERAPQGVDVATMLWWLSDSGDLRHIPTFLRFSTDAEDDSELFAVVVYGLARTARDSTARATLQKLLIGPLPPEQANAASAVLMHVGDEHARRILRTLPKAGLGPLVGTEVAEVLDSPGNATKYWPCPQPLVFAQRGDGKFGCRSPVGVPPA